jgi:hypothetical protein
MFKWPMIESVLRHVLTALAGGWAAKGFFSEDLTGEVVGSFLFLVGVAWSAWRKKKDGSI